MKKIALILSIVLLISLSAVAFAENKVDFSLFPKNKYNINTDEFTGNFTISPTSTSGYFEHSDSDRYKSNITAILGNASGIPNLSIYINYMADNWIFAEDVMVKVGDNVYTFENASIHTEVMDGDIQELFCFSVFTEKGKQMMEDWVSHTGNIRIRLSGNKNFDFTVPPAAQKELSEFYKLSLFACGMSTEAPTAEHIPDNGIYEAVGTGKGFIGNVEVKVTTDGKKILSVEVLSCGDTPGICDEPVEKIPVAIVNANSTNVDCITGATMTSRAIIQAVEEALLLLPHN